MKNETKVAIYGIGHIKDIRLHNFFDQNKIKFGGEKKEDYFNILVVHQNRYKISKKHNFRFKGIRTTGASYKSCINNQQIPDFINLIIWGHEHESIPEIIHN